MTSDNQGNTRELSTSLAEVRAKRAKSYADQWIANYRAYVRKPDSLGSSDHSGEFNIDPRFGVRADHLFDLVYDRHGENLELVNELREKFPHIRNTIGETPARNFMLFFRDRVADVYFVSARRDTDQSSPSKFALHAQSIDVQRLVIRTFAQQALEFAVFMGNQGAVLDMPTLDKMARHSPVIYLDDQDLIDHYFDLLGEGAKPAELRQRFFNSPRLTARNGKGTQYSFSHPSLGNVGKSPAQSNKPELIGLDGNSQGEPASGKAPQLRIVR